MRRQMVQTQVEVNAEKIVDYYEQNREKFAKTGSVEIGLILIKASLDQPSAASNDVAAQAIMELDAKVPFETVAKKYSQETDDIDRRGQLNWLNKEDLRPELNDIAFSLAPGSHSQPIQLGDNIFILYVADKRLGEITPLAEVRDQIKQFLASEKIKANQKRWIERLRKKAYIKYM